jgi:hypothetical protein
MVAEELKARNFLDSAASFVGERAANMTEQKYAKNKNELVIDQLPAHRENLPLKIVSILQKVQKEKE